MGRSLVKGMIGGGRSGWWLVWRGRVQCSVIGDGLIDLLSHDDPRPLKAAEEVLCVVEVESVLLAKFIGIFGQNPGICDSRWPERWCSIDQPLRCGSAGKGGGDNSQKAGNDGAQGRVGHGGSSGFNTCFQNTLHQY